MVVVQGDVYWADLPPPQGSEAGFRRPVVVVQGDVLNRSSIRTVVCIPLTRNPRHARGIGNVELSAASTGLPQDSVANVAQIFALNQSLLLERVGHLSMPEIERLLGGLDVMLGRTTK